ncbi:MAG TPA: threonine/serine exporter family protein [Paenibacillus sp.]
MEITSDHTTHDIINVCLLVGKIMLQSGAETYRVEDTMNRIASSLGLPHSHSYVTPTGIVFQADGTESARLIRIVERTTDLQKVVTANGISRQLTSGQISVQTAHEMLMQVDVETHAFPIWVQIIAASIASGCFAIMFQGGWRDFGPAILCGGLGYSTLIYLHRLVKVKFFAELMGSFLIGIFSLLLVNIGFGQALDKIIIGSVMPLVPGLLITNAVRDLMAGHLVSGLSRGAEAFLTAFAIGTGIAVVLTIF